MDISLVDIGNSAGQSSSFHDSWPPGTLGPWAMILSQPLGLVPPLVPTLPVSTLRKNSARETCQPPRLPAVAARHTWADRALPAVATMLGELLDLLLRHLRLLGGVRERVLRVVLGEHLHEGVEVVGGELGVEMLQVRRPVDPPPDELAVHLVGAQEVRRHRQQDGRLAARPGRDPQIRVGRGVGQPRVEHHELGATGDLALHDPLGVRVEVVPRLQVARDQQDDLGVGVVRRGPVVAAPQRVAEPGTGRADVRVAVVAVHPPGQQEALREAVLTGPADVVDDLVLAVLDDRRPDPSRDVVERVVPADPLPVAAAALPGATQRIQDALGVVDLVDRGRPLGAVATARSRVGRVALELLDRHVRLVDVGQQPAGRLAVEARGGHEHVLVRHLARVRLRVVLHVVVPVGDRREVAQAFVGALPRQLQRGDLALRLKRHDKSLRGRVN